MIGESRHRRVNGRAISRWRGSVLRAGLPVALFALVVQALVSFGHHHFGLGTDHVGRALAVAQAVSTVARHRDRPTRQAPTAPAHEPCLICLAVHAAAAPAADPLQVRMPCDVVCAVLQQPAGTPIAVTLRVAAFESRGPPTA